MGHSDAAHGRSTMMGQRPRSHLDRRTLLHFGGSSQVMKMGKQRNELASAREQ